MFTLFGIIGIALIIGGFAVYGKTCGHGSILVEAECIDIINGYPVYHYEFLEKEFTSSPNMFGRSKKNPPQFGKCHIFINGRVPTTIYPKGLRKLAIILWIAGIVILAIPVVTIASIILILTNMFH